MAALVHKFETESGLMRAWRTFILVVDNKVVTGCNIVKSFLPYINKRNEFVKKIALKP